MLLEQILNIFTVTSIVCGGLSLYFLIGLGSQIKKKKALGAAKKTVGLSLFSLITLSASFLLVGIQGYQAFTQETLVAKITIVPLSSQKYRAIVEFESGEKHQFVLAGDEIMFEANVLKWKPWANVLGLETAYRMDRIRGRFKDINDERNRESTIFALSENTGLDLSKWRKEYQQLSYLLDVEHGSASYASVEEIQYFDLMMTTNGLLLRPDQ
jgi:hypothetical protein